MAEDRLPGGHARPQARTVSSRWTSTSGALQRSRQVGLLLAEATDSWALTQPTFFVSALGRVPKWGSAALSTGLLMSEGTDSVLRILATEEGEPSAGTRLSQRNTHPKRRRRGRERAQTHLEGRRSGRRGPPWCICCGTSTWGAGGGAGGGGAQRAEGRGLERRQGALPCGPATHP